MNEAAEIRLWALRLFTTTGVPDVALRMADTVATFVEEATDHEERRIRSDAVAAAVDTANADPRGLNVALEDGMLIPIARRYADFTRRAAGPAAAETVAAGGL